MTRVVYKRCSMTLDTETIRKSKELANQKAQSVSSFVRYLVGQGSSGYALIGALGLKAA